MLSTNIVIIVSLCYVGILFTIAWWADRCAKQNKSIINNPIIYTLSIAVYCTTWTFYGSVGYAARSGLEFLTIYFGPTFIFLGWWFLLRKMVHITKTHGITSIADFISSRYGKSGKLSVIVTLIAVIGITPYIALQLKAVATSFTVLTGFGIEKANNLMIDGRNAPSGILTDTGFWVTLLLVIFAILFGTRHIDTDEHHEGVVAAIAFESLVKLIVILAVGLFVVFFAYNGFGDLFTTAKHIPAAVKALTLDENVGPRWLTLTLLSMAAILALPRQFQMIAVENVNERHLATASWLFPAYLVLMNIFVLPIALAGLDLLPDSSDPDFFVLTVPLFLDQKFLALIAYVGGLSAAISMVIVAVIALSTMVCNDLVVPILLRRHWLHTREKTDLTGILLTIRRFSIFLLLFMGYAYYRGAGTSNALVSIGLISFTATAQLVPVMIIGLFWKGGAKHGAQVGLILGFSIWIYTLVAPSFARSGWIDTSFIINGPWHIDWLKPEALFGLGGISPLTHALFWSMFFNIGSFVIVSVFSRQNSLERIQAALFVDSFSVPLSDAPVWQGNASIDDLYDLVQRFLGGKRTINAFKIYAKTRGDKWQRDGAADSDTIAFTERLLAGTIGAASARIVVSSVGKGEVMRFDEVMTMLEETSQVIEHSNQLEQKSQELELVAGELRLANERLRELDLMKDDFLTVVSHEFRTPLTSIRSFSEILADNSDLDEKQTSKFLNIIIKESERLTRLIDEHLDLARVEAGQSNWRIEAIDMTKVIKDSIAAIDGMLREKHVQLSLHIPNKPMIMQIDNDRMMQVFLNLLSNAIKFCNPHNPQILITAKIQKNGYLFSVIDNGQGLPEAEFINIFDKFARVDEDTPNRPTGSGLGLAISKRVVEYFNGEIWVEMKPMPIKRITTEIIKTKIKKIKPTNATFFNIFLPLD